MFYFMSTKDVFSSLRRESRPEGATATRGSIISHIQEIPFHLTRYSRQARNVTTNRFGYLKINHLHNEDARRLIYSPAPEKVNFSDDNEMHFRTIAIDSVISPSGYKVSFMFRISDDASMVI